MLVSCISIKLAGTLSLRCLFHLVLFSKLKNNLATPLVLPSRWQQQSSSTSKYWEPLIRISRHSLHTDSNNRTVPVSSTRAARNASFVQLQKWLPSYDAIVCFCGASDSTPIWTSLFVMPLSFSQVQNCLVTMALCFVLRCQRQHSYFRQFRCVPYRYLLL